MLRSINSGRPIIGDDAVLNAEHRRAARTALRTQTISGIVGDDTVGDVYRDRTVRSVEPYSAAAIF